MIFITLSLSSCLQLSIDVEISESISNAMLLFAVKQSKYENTYYTLFTLMS